MAHFSTNFNQTRDRNAKALAAFGFQVAESGNVIRVIREGTQTTLYTIGYEKRDGESFIALLLDQGIKVLADVREKPMSRKPDFRGKALKALCDEAGIEYQSWASLGSTSEQRDDLNESKNFKNFAKDFRVYIQRTMQAELDRLSVAMQQKPTALMCYERDHFECHRSVISDLVAGKINATVVAL